ncbi:hypothetical protein ACOBQB_00215 [Streptomyces sp. G5(2025)]|uniref:hypothetical protein n=1 Tax=Streptomyces sp. G5(2025) TaxID=3406628 RepID=UPI003C25059F
MSDTFIRSVLRRASVWLLFLAVAAVVSVVLLAPRLLLPRIGDTFTPAPANHSAPATAGHAAPVESRSDSDACDLIVGPAKAYCLKHDPDAERSSQTGLSTTGVIVMVPAVFSLGVLLGRRRCAS